MRMFETPVALFIFNRPDTTRRVFQAIAQVQPAKLLLIADGPRANNPSDAAACPEVRDIVSRVDWPCEVFTNFAGRNLGCQERMISGLNWVFSLVEEAIILEDDCLPDLTFFPFCHELLEKYRGDQRVAAISGTNLVAKYMKTEASYFFSQLGGIWGWATWRTQWQQYDRGMQNWPELKRVGILSEAFDQPRAANYWTRIFDDMYENGGRNTWDYQWLYTRLINHALTIIPCVNLVENIGFSQGATHTGSTDSRLTPAISAVGFPLVHPSSFIPLLSTDRHYQDLFERSLIRRISAKLRRLITRYPR